MDLGRPALISLSQTIEANNKKYYSSIEANNFKLDLTEFLLYFGETILAAQQHTIKTIDFLIQKARFFDKYSTLMNERQLKVIQRMFKAGHKGFNGGAHCG